MVLRSRIVYFLVVVAFAFTGCARQAVQLAQPSQPPVVITQLVTVIVVVTATPEFKHVQATPQTLAEETSAASWILPTEAINHIGSKVRVRVESAWCSFQAGINGTPTFCNDQPYPNHSFTFLVWGEDWSHLDQKCVVVDGLVELYQGMPQIVVLDLEQVEDCGE